MELSSNENIEIDQITISMDRVANINEFRKSERLICIICQSLLISPVKCSDCLVHFCQICIENWVKKSNTCPNCRSKFEKDKLERTLKEDLEDTRIYCCFKPNGCNEISPYEKLFTHQNQCGMKPSQCRWCQCKNWRKDIIPHEITCENRCFECLGCLTFIPYLQFPIHETQCLKNELKILREKIADIKPQKKDKKMKFSQNSIYRHEGITVVNQKLSKMKIDEFQKNSVILLKPKLKNKLVSWIIKINKLTCWIALGIGNGALLSSEKFCLSDAQVENMRHGSYFFSSNGLAWSSDIKQENYKPSFKFESGDIIIIEYDPVDKILRFAKNQQKKTLQLSNNFLSGISGNIYAIAILGGVDDSVEIIESKFM